MKRFHFFEIEDQVWCPAVVRDGVTDFIGQLVSVFGLYKPVLPRLMDALGRSGHLEIVDLCSGGAGPLLSLMDGFKQHMSGGVPDVMLTDLYPNHSAFNAASRRYPETIQFSPDPVDAANVPKEMRGFRTLFSSFHHLKPEVARAVLQNAVDSKAGIAIFESTQRHPLILLYMLITPLLVFALTPFIRPFLWRRLFWTYLIPVIPFVVLFDGVVSCLRTYTVDELHEMIQGVDAPGYKWEIGLERIGFLPVGVTYLIGVPNESE